MQVVRKEHSMLRASFAKRLRRAVLGSALPGFCDAGTLSQNRRCGGGGGGLDYGVAQISLNSNAHFPAG